MSSDASVKWLRDQANRLVLWVRLLVVTVVAGAVIAVSQLLGVWK